PEAAAGESCLGVADRGIWSDLDGELQLSLPAGVTADRVEALVSGDGDTLIVYVDGWPTKPYPLGGAATLAVGDTTLALRAGDRDELAGLLTADHVRRLAGGEAPPPGDRDGDDLPDPLDVLIGARKAVLNGASYTQDYFTIGYPMGDPPRDKGSCTDVVVRSLRNAGLDLQVEVRRDIAASPRSYPMVKGKGNPSIDHRRVRTILPYFRRHLEAHSAALDDPDDPLRPGDVVFMDTFPSRAGPDHIGVISDRLGDDGLPLVINNWTDGTVDAEMDLLGWVPVLYRFRVD
ncbi:MAG: DUF1287 domain-containing protein, partial [Myxococcales bacterium]|nr:DUF1287 domain-containing protein [Myxococcales bacterium]